LLLFVVEGVVDDSEAAVVGFEVEDEVEVLTFVF
jgi:hypothetical protein